MTREEYILLYEKYLNGKCSNEELQFLENYNDNFSIDTVSYWDTARMGDEEAFKKKALLKIESQINKDKVVGFRWKRYVSVAAVLAIISSVLLLYKYIQDDKDSSKIIVAKKKEKLIEQTESIPILTLNDGEKISLGDSSVDAIYTEKGGMISRKGNNEIVYTEASNVDKIPRYNTLEVPKGMSYKIVLADGSIVWLNAGSVLKFPVAFVGKERKVELLGEAYFDIAKDKLKPFKVIANKSEIEVLGTEFNVNAYQKDITRTTLIEGVVKLNGAKSKAVLKPGQMGIDTKTGSIELKKANIESIIDWKEGLFIFNDENLETILEKVSKWYGVEIEYKGETPSDYLYYGKLERTVTLDELLKSIELTGKVKFETVQEAVQGKERRIIVTTYK